MGRRNNTKLMSKFRGVHADWTCWLMWVTHYRHVPFLVRRFVYTPGRCAYVYATGHRFSNNVQSWSKKTIISHKTSLKKWKMQKHVEHFKQTLQEIFQARIKAEIKSGTINRMKDCKVQRVEPFAKCKQSNAKDKQPSFPLKKIPLVTYATDAVMK